MWRDVGERQRFRIGSFRLATLRLASRLGGVPLMRPNNRPDGGLCVFASIALTVAMIVALPAFAQESNPIIGRASVIDGDTIEIHGERIHVHGIDAPES